MKLFTDANFRRDIIKLICVATVFAGGSALFLLTPSLSTPTMISIVTTMLLSPLVATLERRGHKRSFSILILFSTIGLAGAASTLWGLQRATADWDSFKETAPQVFHASMTKLQGYEDRLKADYPALKSVHPTQALLKWGEETGKWFVDNGAGLVGTILTCLFIVPLLTFVLLNEGPMIRKGLFQLVPNRYFESFFIVTNDILTSLSDYLRAKLVEAFLVGLITTLGLIAVKAPYALVLGIVAGVTNILPYAGPVLGAVPGILIAALSDGHSHLLWPITLVYVIANVIDNVVIFPVVVAKLVNLHPLLLIAVVFVGQQYYGLIGMLISIPIATALKVILTEVYATVYENRSNRRITDADLESAGIPLLGGE